MIEWASMAIEWPSLVDGYLFLVIEWPSLGIEWPSLVIVGGPAS